MDKAFEYIDLRSSIELAALLSLHVDYLNGA